MVGLVIVSHHRKLAEGLLELARQVAPAEAALAFAAGAGDTHEEIGTDAVEIAAAIRSVWSEAGVLVLMDLGSAVLSAELALEFLSEEERRRVRLCAAPLVEGTLAAAAQLAVRADLEAVYQEALNALIPKQTHLTYPAEQASDIQLLATLTTPESEEHAIIVRLENPHGLHARPATQLMQSVARFDAQVWVANLERPAPPVSAVSLNALLSLNALEGHRLQITARGRQAAQALVALQDLIAEWGRKATREEKPLTLVQTDQPSAVQPLEQRAGMLKGTPIAEGYAVAPAYFFRPHLIETKPAVVASPSEEWRKLQEAIRAVQADLQTRYERMKDRLGEDEASIFQAHQLFLNDPLLLDRVQQRIAEGHIGAVQAWKQACEEFAQPLQAAEDPYFRQRALDLFDVTSQVIKYLSKGVIETVQLPEAAILVADDLTPNQVAEFDLQRVLGVVLVRGAATTHSAILLRGLGIPAVGEVDLAQWELREGDQLGIDGKRGLVWLQPSPEVSADLEAKQSQWKRERQRLIQGAQELAQTKDGQRIEIAANVGSLAEARLAVESGAEAIGVLRTEFLYQNRLEPPSEEEQFQTYCQIAEIMRRRPVVLRTLDVGGDKLPAYLFLPPEANPYLGLRGIRVTLRETELFSAQLRALLRAAAVYPLRLLLPMVATLEELDQAQALLHSAHEALERAGMPDGYPIPVGIMVETPASVYLAESFAEKVDFFSIGTNDLTQYTLAAERGNPNLRAYQDALHPAILCQIHQVVRAAHQHKRWVAVCGEVAAESEALPILDGLGVDELSMNPNAIPRQKALLAQIDRCTASALAQQALRCGTAAQVRELARQYLAEGNENHFIAKPR